MTISLKFLIVGLVALGEAIAILIVARTLPETRSGVVLPVVVLSSVLSLGLIAYLIFYFL